MTDRQGDGWLDEVQLAAVPWGKLRHARGKADGLPKILRNLGSPSERARKVARLELDDALWEGPRTFTAGVAAVPFLVDSVLHTPYPDRAATLRLLALLAVGAPDACIAFPPTAARLKALPKTVRDASAAVTRRVPELVGLLDDPLPAMRASASFLLALLPRAGRDVIARLDAAADREDDEITRAALLVACGVARATQEVAAPGPRSIDRRASVLLRGADAVGRSFWRALDPEELATVADLALGCEPIDEDRFAWALGQPLRLGVTRLVLAGPAARPLAGRLATSLRENSPHGDKVLIGGAVLELAFAGFRELGRRVLPADLDAEQIAILDHLGQVRAELDYLDVGLPQFPTSWDGARGVRELVEDARRGPVAFDTPVTVTTAEGSRTEAFSTWVASGDDAAIAAAVEVLVTTLPPPRLLEALCAAGDARRAIRGLRPTHWIPLLPRLGPAVDEARRLVPTKLGQDLASRQSLILLLALIVSHTTDELPAEWEPAGKTVAISLGLGPLRQRILERFPEGVREGLLAMAARAG